MFASCQFDATKPFLFHSAEECLYHSLHACSLFFLACMFRDLQKGFLMAKAQAQKTEEMQLETVRFLSLGGVEDVTRNMYVYEYKNQILLVDCGLGFPDETMLGVDLLLPDITYLLQNCLPEGKATKTIVGMLLTHGHEDHIGDRKSVV